MPRKKSANRPLDSLPDRFTLLKVFRVNPVAMLIVSTRRMIIQSNAAFRQLSGRSIEDLEGRDLADFFPELSSDFSMAVRDGVISGEQSVCWERATLCGIDGTCRNVRRCFEVLLDESASIIGVLMMFEDIEDIIQSEQDRKSQQELLRYLNRRLVSAQEEEWKRIAAELHDEWGQVLSSMKLDLELMDPESHQVGERLGHKVDLLVASTRQLSRTLRPSLLDKQGLQPALENLVSDFSRHCKAELHFDTATQRLSEDLEITCFRLVQESLTNIRRHARAREVAIRVIQHDDVLNIEIVDDGNGFDPENAASEAANRGSAGLIGMAERARACGGEFNVFSREGMGTRISVRLPAEMFDS